MKKGFTLIELLVTVSIIAILTGLSLVAFNGTKATSRDAKRKADLESIRSALELYRADYGGYPLSTNYPSALQPTYITVPTDPVSSHLYSYKPSTCGTSFCSTYVICAGLEQVTAADAACTTAGAACGTGVTCSYHASNP